MTQDHWGAFLIDLDGTLCSEDHAIEGASEALLWLREREIPFLIVTNTTRESRGEIVQRLARLSIDVSEKEVFPVPLAAIQYILGQSQHRCFLIAARHIIKEFLDAGIDLSDENQQVDCVVMSTFEGMDLFLLNKVFRLVNEGAKLLAMHRDVSYVDGGELFLGLGAYVAAIEVATGKAATILGKPSPHFFRMAVRRLGASSGKVAMIGDHLLVDIQGAQQAGLVSILVETGKHRKSDLTRIPVRPDILLPSIASLPELF
jgi:HAD superfamily hydrolase (TIGR01458 family)